MEDGLKIHSVYLLNKILPSCIEDKFYDMIWCKFQKKGGEENDTEREIYE
jgi:hypothetical protein